MSLNVHHVTRYLQRRVYHGFLTGLQVAREERAVEVQNVLLSR
jgi:hypothetical protein